MKKSSYQKLKEENNKLKNDIYLLVMDGSFNMVEQLKAKYRMSFGMTDAVMFGTRKVMSPEEKETVHGLIDHSMPLVVRYPIRPS